MTTTNESHPATVTNANDPEKRGRIKVACAAILGDEETELPMWVEPLPMWGWFVVPDVGEVVEVEVLSGSSEDDSHGQITIDSLDIKWRGDRYWGNSEGPSPRPVPEDFTKTNYGKRRGYATPAGHVMLFDDADDGRKVTMTWKSKDGKYSSFGIDPDGSFVVNTVTGHTLYLDSKNGAVSLVDQFGNSYSSDTDGIRLISKDSDIVSMKSGNIQILAQAGAVISAGNVHLDAGEINLGDGLTSLLTEYAILGTTFLTLFANHVHPTTSPGSPTLAPVPGAGGAPATWMAALSQVVKLK